MAKESPASTVGLPDQLQTVRLRRLFQRCLDLHEKHPHFTAIAIRSGDDACWEAICGTDGAVNFLPSLTELVDRHAWLYDLCRSDRTLSIWCDRDRLLDRAREIDRLRDAGDDWKSELRDFSWEIQRTIWAAVLSRAGFPDDASGCAAADASISGQRWKVLITDPSSGANDWRFDDAMRSFRVVAAEVLEEFSIVTAPRLAMDSSAMKPGPNEHIQLAARLFELFPEDPQRLEMIEARALKGSLFWTTSKALELRSSAADSGPGADGDAEPSPDGKATANARMLDMIQRRPDSRGWKARQWAHALCCSPSTVHGTPMWKQLQEDREAVKLARQMRRQE